MSPRSVRPIVLVSACLMGRNVRYDGGHEKCRFLTREFVGSVRIIEICPEVELGLGVPRDTLRLVRGSKAKNFETQLLVFKSGKNLTVRAKARFKKLIRGFGEIHGAVLKSGSPSCGLRRVKLYSSATVFERVAQGLFVQVLQALRPRVALCDEKTFVTPRGRKAFLKKVVSLAEAAALTSNNRIGKFQRKPDLNKK